MDLNELYFRHQIALMRAACAHSHAERDLHLAAADEYARRIARFQRSVGARAAPLMQGASL